MAPHGSPRIARVPNPTPRGNLRPANVYGRAKCRNLVDHGQFILSRNRVIMVDRPRHIVETNTPPEPRIEHGLEFSFEPNLDIQLL